VNVYIFIITPKQQTVEDSSPKIQNNNSNNNSEFRLYSAFFCKKNPKRAACASLVEREEKGFEVVLKR